MLPPASTPPLHFPIPPPTLPHTSLNTFLHRYTHVTPPHTPNLSHLPSAIPPPEFSLHFSIAPTFSLTSPHTPTHFPRPPPHFSIPTPTLTLSSPTSQHTSSTTSLFWSMSCMKNDDSGFEVNACPSVRDRLKSPRAIGFHFSLARRTGAVLCCLFHVISTHARCLRSSLARRTGAENFASVKISCKLR